MIPVVSIWDFIGRLYNVPREFFGAFAFMKSRYWLIVISIVLMLVIWQLVASFAGFPAFILPTPAQVAARFAQAIQDGSLIRNTAATLVEVLAGLTLGVCVATVLGYLLARSLRLEHLLSPYIVASQAIPIVAIAP